MQSGQPEDAYLALGRLIAALISGPRLIDLGGMTAETSTSAAATAVLREPPETLTDRDVAVLVAEDRPLAEYAEILLKTSRRGVPTFVAHHVGDHPKAFMTEAEVEEVLSAARYKIAARNMITHTMMAKILLPAARLLPEGWGNPDRLRILRRLKKRGVRHLEIRGGLTPQVSWTGSSKWAPRAAFVASFLQPDLRVLDVGCGSMDLEQFAAARDYIPVDIAPRDDRTLILNLNLADLPAGWLAEADVVSFIGVFEYLEDPSRHLGRLAAAGRAMICTYNVAEGRQAKNSALNPWSNSFSEGGFRDLLSRSGLRLFAARAYNDKQWLYAAVPAGFTAEESDRIFRLPATADPPAG